MNTALCWALRRFLRSWRKRETYETTLWSSTDMTQIKINTYNPKATYFIRAFSNQNRHTSYSVTCASSPLQKRQTILHKLALFNAVLHIILDINAILIPILILDLPQMHLIPMQAHQS